MLHPEIPRFTILPWKCKCGSCKTYEFDEISGIEYFTEDKVWLVLHDFNKYCYFAKDIDSGIYHLDIIEDGVWELNSWTSQETFQKSFEKAPPEIQEYVMWHLEKFNQGNLNGPSKS